MRHFGRKIRVTFKNEDGSTIVINPDDSVGLVELKVAFEVSKNIESSANSATLRLWNLNASTRNAVGKEFDEVVIEAGYIAFDTGESNVGIVFEGQLRDVQHSREGPDIITTLTTGDGDAALRNATTSKSFPAGTKISEVIDSIYDDLKPYGVRRGETQLPEKIKDKKLERPYAMCGSSKRELDRLGRGYGFYWSIQNGTFEIVPGDGVLDGPLEVAAYPYGTMVGTPTITDNGVSVSMLLEPECRPNRLIRVRSEVLEMNGEDGEFRIGQVQFSADNTDGDFQVTATSESIKEKTGGKKKVDEGKKKKKTKKEKPKGVAV